MNKIDFFKGLSGRQVTLTNAVTNGNFASTSNWTSSGVSFSVASNEASFLANSINQSIKQTVSLTNARKYYFCSQLKASSASVSFRLSDVVDNITVIASDGSGAYQFASAIYTATRTVSTGRLDFIDGRSSDFNTINMRYVSMIDLTAAFGAGNEPTKAQMDTLMTQFANNWLNGTQSAFYNW